MIEAIVIGVIVLFVWLCMKKGDTDYTRATHKEPAAPGAVRVLFLLFVGGLLFIIFGIPTITALSALGY